MKLHPSKPLLLALATMLQTWSGYWDVYSHTFVFRQDPPLNPAHVALVASTLAALWLSLRLFRESPTFRLPFIGTTLGLGAGAWNEVQHRILGEIEPISPPHAAYVISLIVTQLGLIIALTRDRDPRTSEGEIKLALFALWLTVSGSSLYVAGLLSSASRAAALALLNALPTLVLVPSALSGLNRMALQLSSALYAANALPLLLLGLGQLPWLAFLPLAPLAGFALDIFAPLVRGRQRMAGAWLGLFAALLSPLLYYPFSLRALPQDPLPYLVASFVGMGAGYMGTAAAKALLSSPRTLH